MTHARLMLMNALARSVLGSADHCITLDGCYGALARAPDTSHLLVSVAPRVRGCTLIVSSLSKSLALIGMRIRYLAGPKAVISAVEALQRRRTFKPNVIEQHALPQPLPLLRGFAKVVKICFWLIAVAYVVSKRLRTDGLNRLHGPLRLVEGRNGAGECDGHKTDQHSNSSAEGMPPVQTRNRINLLRWSSPRPIKPRTYRNPTGSSR